VVEAGGELIGAPRPERRDAAVSGDWMAEPCDTGVPATDARGALSPVSVLRGASGALDTGAPRPAGGVADVDVEDSAQRLTVRTGPVPRGGGVVRLPAVRDDPCAANEAEDGRPDALKAADGLTAGPRERCVTATGSGPLVRGLAAGVTVAAGATVARCRIGAVSTATEAAATEGVAGIAEVGVAATRAASSGPADQSAAPSLGAAVLEARRWTDRVGMGAREVRLGTVETWAVTRPGGADGPVSCPSGCTIGGSGRCPGTSARNGAAGATKGGAPVVRWMGGSVAQAPVAGASEAATGASWAAPTGEAPSRASSGMWEGCPSDGVLRPNGQGRRTGLTPPRTGAC
jgi:hypothetical protein